MENGDVNTVFLAWSLIFGLFAAAHTDIINVVILGFLFILLGISVVNERYKNERSLFICVFIQFCIVISVFVLRYLWRIGYCYKYECCDTQWISANISGLATALSQKVYGQHLVLIPTIKHLRGHWNGQTQKPLVLSLHGLPGTGKTYVSTLIAQHLYVEGVQSKYVHQYSSSWDFRDQPNVEKYHDDLIKTITTSVSECPKSLFIFDEIDKFPNSFSNVLTTLTDYALDQDGVDYRSSIFLLLSNTGADEIANFTLQQYEIGRERYRIQTKEVQSLLQNTEGNINNSLWFTELTRHGLITAYLPFLPLDKSHVVQCILDGLFFKGYYTHEYQISVETVRQILDELEFFPENKNLFAKVGCKKVWEKIDLVLQPLA